MKLYCDLDGVLTDFELQVLRLTGKEAKNQLEDKMWEKINSSGVTFWSQMPWKKDGKELWNFIKKYKPIILSSPTTEDSKLGKEYWVRHELGAILILKESNEKRELADPDSILIDDRPDIIEQWKKAGGKGIVHKNAIETIKELKIILKDYFGV